MSHPVRQITARCLRAAAPVCLLLAACGPTDEPSVAPARYRAPLPVPRRTANPDPENAKWLAAWRDLRTRLAPLEGQLASAQKVHGDNQLDSFLELDPESIDQEELCSLFHFLERGYFTVERQILIHLLERRLQRVASPVAVPSKSSARFKDRLVAAMHRDELRMLDLESALAHYREPGEADFQIPASLTEEELAELRTAVVGMLEKTRGTVAEMDRKIEALKAQVFGETAPP